MTGMLIRKLSRAAESRSKPVQRAAVIVIPDRDVPGLRASACAAPTLSESATPRSSSGRSPFCWSAHHNNKPNTINDTPMIHGSPSDSSIQSSNMAPTSAAGTVASSEQPGDPALDRRRPLAAHDQAQALSDVHGQVVTEVADDSDQGADVEADVERLLDRLVAGEVVPTEQPRHEDEVPARRDREEFRQTLHETEHDGVEDRHGRRRYRPLTSERWSLPGDPGRSWSPASACRRRRGVAHFGRALVGQPRLTRSGLGRVADGRSSRRRGLLGRDHMEGALVLRPCRWIHTIGMRFPIDVAYLDEEGVVIKTMQMHRHRVGMPVWRGDHVIEAEAGAFARWGLRVGDVIDVRDDDA